MGALKKDSREGLEKLKKGYKSVGNDTSLNGIAIKKILSNANEIINTVNKQKNNTKM